MTDYEFHREPFAHQRRSFEETRDLEAHALLWEQRTGKSQTVIDTAAWNYERGRIDALLVIAPAGVHSNWVRESVPECLPTRVPRSCLVWRASRAKTKAFRDEFEEMLAFDGLAVLAVNYDSLITSAIRSPLNRFLTRRKVLAVADESDAALCSPSTKRTIACVGRWNGGGIARRVAMRRIVTGTPVTESPFDAFSQFNFLEFGCLGTKSFATFKATYGEWEEQHSFSGGRGHTYPKLVEHKNLDDLARRVGAFSSRVLRADCADLPPVMRQTVRFELSIEQRMCYRELQERFRAELGGKTVTAPDVLQRWLRLQQISSGFAVPDAASVECRNCAGEPTEECEQCGGWGWVPDEAKAVILPNPRRDAYAREVAGTEGQTVTFCRFRHDVDECCKAHEERRSPFARFDGTVEARDRDFALELFRSGAVKHVVATEAAGGRGLDLSAADVVFFYSHGWSLRQRLQAEDRIINLGKRRSVAMVDFVADDTVDDAIVAAHVEKRKLSDVVTGDWRLGDG